MTDNVDEPVVDQVDEPVVDTVTDPDTDPIVIDTPAVEFPEGLEDDIKADPSLQVFIKDGKINYANMMKSYVHAQKKMGDKGVHIPDENSSKEDWDSFYNKMGRPSLEEYKVEPSLAEGQEVDTDMVNGFKQAAHEAGILPKQAQNLMDWFNKHSSEAQTAFQQSQQEAYDKQLEGLKKDWGESFEPERKLADSALREFASEQEVEYLVDSGFADDPTVVRLFNKIGKGLGEDTFTTEAKGTFGMSPEAAQTKVNEYMNDPNGAYLNPDHANHKQAVAEVYKLNSIIHN